MRITAGCFKARRVRTVDSNDVRPTSSKIRESIFNMIQTSIVDSTMLDLFAGSGMMGLEALSRGAKRVVFVEKNPRVGKILKENISNFDCDCQVFINDALLSLDRFSENSFNIIFIDPPYATDLVKLSLEKIIKNNLLSEDGLIVLEYSSKTDMLKEMSVFGLDIIKEKVYGDTTICILKTNIKACVD